VIATQMKVDVAGVVLPERLTDEYFRRTQPEKKPGEDSNLFTDSKQVRLVAYPDSVGRCDAVKNFQTNFYLVCSPDPLS